MSQLVDEPRLTAYLNADSKYQVVPIPAPVDPSKATQFINNHVKDRLPPDKMSKLARLAILHDLRDTAPAFRSVLKSNEQKTPDFHRSAWAVIALAWIGNSEQVKFAQNYLHQLQARADVWENRLIMLDATEAFGPTEGTDKHRAWVAEEIGRRKTLSNQYETQNKQNEARGVEIQIDELEEHLNVRVAAVDRSNEIRSLILGSAVDARISRLVALYLGTEPVTPALAAWAGFTLSRMGKQEQATKAKIAAQFAAAAKQHERTESERNAQLALVRARSLRAVEFFGGALSEPHSEWLKTQKDEGADLLALRPYWVYQ